MTSNPDRQDIRGKLPRTPKANSTRPDTGFSGPQRGFYSDVATVGASQKLGVSSQCPCIQYCTRQCLVNTALAKRYYLYNVLIDARNKVFDAVSLTTKRLTTSILQHFCTYMHSLIILSYTGCLPVE